MLSCAAHFYFVRSKYFRLLNKIFFAYENYKNLLLFISPGQCGNIANKIALSLNEARSFFGRGGEKSRKRWLFFSETKDLQEECHTETEGCNVEEVMEFYNGDTTDAVSIKRNFFEFPLCM